MQDVRHRIKFCSSICFALLASMNNRYDGMLQRIQVPITQRVSDIRGLPFGSDIYILSAFFDPKFKLRWIDNEIRMEDKHKEDLREEIKGMLLKTVQLHLNNVIKWFHSIMQILIILLLHNMWTKC